MSKVTRSSGSTVFIVGLDVFPVMSKSAFTSLFGCLSSFRNCISTGSVMDKAAYPRSSSHIRRHQTYKALSVSGLTGSKCWCFYDGLKRKHLRSPYNKHSQTTSVGLFPRRFTLTLLPVQPRRRVRANASARPHRGYKQNLLGRLTGIKEQRCWRVSTDRLPDVYSMASWFYTKSWSNSS